MDSDFGRPITSSNFPLSAHESRVFPKGYDLVALRLSVSYECLPTVQSLACEINWAKSSFKPAEVWNASNTSADSPCRWAAYSNSNWLTADTALLRINGSHHDWTGRGYSILKRRHSSYPTLIYFHYPERISFSLVSFQARQLYLDSPLILISLISMWPKLNAIFSSSVEPTVLMISAMSVT